MSSTFYGHENCISSILLIVSLVAIELNITELLTVIENAAKDVLFVPRLRYPQVNVIKQKNINLNNKSIDTHFISCVTLLC